MCRHKQTSCGKTLGRAEVRKMQGRALPGQANGVDQHDLSDTYLTKRHSGCCRFLGSVVRPMQNDGPGICTGCSAIRTKGALCQAQYRSGASDCRSIPHTEHPHAPHVQGRAGDRPPIRSTRPKPSDSVGAGTHLIKRMNSSDLLVTMSMGFRCSVIILRRNASRTACLRSSQACPSTLQEKG